MKTRIAFIIIAYKPKDTDLTRLLGVLPKKDTIIVDNGQSISKDSIGTVTLLPQSANLGYGAAANIGIRYAIGQGYDWFVILNQDILATPEAINLLIKQLSGLEPCIGGPFEGVLDAVRWTTKLGSPLRIGSGERTYISGSCFAVHTKVIDKIGYFYEPFFLYYEEADYCIRAKRAGFAVRTLDISGFHHEETVSLGKGSDTHQYYLSRNHLLFIERQAPYDVKIHELVRLPKSIVEHISRHEHGALAGVRDYFLRRFGPRRSI